MRAHDCREQADVGLCQLIPNQVFPLPSVFAEDLLDPVQRLKERHDVFFVSLLLGSKARFVDAVVDGRIDPFVGGVDLGTEGGRVVVKATVLGIDDRVKLSRQSAGWYSHLGHTVCSPRG